VQLNGMENEDWRTKKTKKYIRSRLYSQYKSETAKWATNSHD